jgi:peptide/nickel transport system substrate-binding protein
MKVLGYLACAILLVACGGSTTEEQTDQTSEYKVVSRAARDIISMNPVTGRGNKEFILYHMFQSLISIDFKSNTIVPILAIGLPEIEDQGEGILHITYTIRPEAKWDNGEPVTAHDVALSIKTLKNPKIDAANQRAYFEFIRDIIIDKNNPQRFTLVCHDAYMLTDVASGSYPVIPEYVYDPQQWMRDISIPMLNEMTDSMSRHQKVRDHAFFFGGLDFIKEVAVGSGPYMLERHEANERTILRKKENWWGNNFTDLNHWFEAYPEQLVAELILDDATAISALKSGEIDVMASIPMKEFAEDLPKSESFVANYNTLTPLKISYEIIGFNLRKPIFEDLYTRLALARLVDVDKIISTVYYGLGERTTSYVHPAHKDFYNERLSNYLFNVEQAKAILDTAGWKDTNGDGTLDRMINGKRVEFEFDLLYNTENERRAKVALMFQENARQAGIKINLVSMEYGSYVTNLRNFEFDAVMRGVGVNPIEPDPKQSWHTSSAQKGGSNFLGFGDEGSDYIIDKLRNTKDKEERAELHKALQNVIHNQVPCIFLNTYKETIAVHKRFGNVYGSTIRPGYWDSGFTLAESITP